MHLTANVGKATCHGPKSIFGCAHTAFGFAHSEFGMLNEGHEDVLRSFLREPLFSTRSSHPLTSESNAAWHIEIRPRTLPFACEFRELLFKKWLDLFLRAKGDHEVATPDYPIGVLPCRKVFVPNRSLCYLDRLRSKEGRVYVALNYTAGERVHVAGDDAGLSRQL
jgi:hypothetical protein